MQNLDAMAVATDEALARLFRPSKTQQWLLSERTTRILAEARREDELDRLTDRRIERENERAADDRLHGNATEDHA